MSTTSKVLLLLFLAAIIAVMVVYAKLTAEMGRKAAEVARLESALAECGYRERDAGRAIERQNAAIDGTRVDTVVVERLIREAERKYAGVREVIIQSLERDTGCENKVVNIDYALRRFHGAGVRPAEGSDKD